MPLIDLSLCDCVCLAEGVIVMSVYIKSPDDLI